MMTHGCLGMMGDEVRSSGGMGRGCVGVGLDDLTGSLPTLVDLKKELSQLEEGLDLRGLRSDRKARFCRLRVMGLAVRHLRGHVGLGKRRDGPLPTRLRLPSRPGGASGQRLAGRRRAAAATCQHPRRRLGSPPLSLQKGGSCQRLFALPCPPGCQPAAMEKLGCLLVERGRGSFALRLWVSAREKGRQRFNGGGTCSPLSRLWA